MNALIYCAQAGLHVPANSHRFSQELQDVPVYFRWGFLLRPMPYPRQQNLLAQIRDIRFHRFVFRAQKLKDRIFLTGDKRSRQDDPRAIQVGRHSPVPIHIAIVVQAAAKSRAFEFRFEKIDIFL